MLILSAVWSWPYLVTWSHMQACTLFGSGMFVGVINLQWSFLQLDAMNNVVLDSGNVDMVYVAYYLVRTCFEAQDSSLTLDMGTTSTGV